jgi:hypothetical protein
MLLKRSKVRQPNSNVAKDFRVRTWLSLSALSLAVSCSTVVLGQTGAATHSRAEVRRTFPLSHFYDTQNPLRPGKPGELIRKEDFDEYDLSANISATRILYHSRSAQGADVASSGVVLYPEGNPPAGGWPIIAWAHDLNGIARQCAPSLSRNLLHGPLLSMYVNLGYAVVATDYTGLGTAFPNSFSDMKSNASDVMNSILAAHAAVPQLGSPWIAIGTGDGSRVVIAVAEWEFQAKDPNYLGAIAMSGLEDLQERYQRPDQSALLLLAYGVKTVFPPFNLRDILTDKGQAVLMKLEAACTEAQADPKLRDSELVKGDWRNNSAVQQYFARNQPGEKTAYRPILAIAGEPDPGGATAKVIARMCGQGDQVQFERYEIADPGSVIGDSVRSQIAWMQDRFAGRPAPNNCGARH